MNLKATKEQIIETALHVLEKYEPLNKSSITARKQKILISTTSNEYYYKHDGWFFMIHGAKSNSIGNEKTIDSYLLYFLDDGTCIRLAVDDGEGGSAIMTHLIYREDIGYQRVSKEKFLAHHNFNFNDSKFEKIIR